MPLSNFNELQNNRGIDGRIFIAQDPNTGKDVNIEVSRNALDKASLSMCKQKASEKYDLNNVNKDGIVIVHSMDF